MIKSNSGQMRPHKRYTGYIRKLDLDARLATMRGIDEQDELMSLWFTYQQPMGADVINFFSRDTKVTVSFSGDWDNKTIRTAQSIEDAYIPQGFENDNP